MIFKWIFDWLAGIVLWLLSWLVPAGSGPAPDVSMIGQIAQFTNLIGYLVDLQLLFFLVGAIVFFESARAIYWVVIRIKGLLLFS